jgi:hypothetical protein
MDFRLFLLRHVPLLRVLFRWTVRLLLPRKLVKARLLEHYSHIRIDAKRQALDALDAARRNAAPNGNGDGDSGKGKEEPRDEGGIDALVEVSAEFTSQSRHSLRLSGSPPSGKLLIPLERRDVRVVEGARLESESGDAHEVTLKHLAAHSIQRFTASSYASM